MEERGYKSRLNNARARRKRVEADAQLLTNRISLLKMEEAKAWKRIEATKRRAEQILAVRQDNQAKLVDHAGRRNNAVGVSRSKTDRRYVEKELQRQKRLQVKKRGKLIKQELVKQFKVERQRQQKEVADIRRREIKLACDRNAAVRKKREEGRAKRLALKRKKIAEAKREFERRIKVEDDERSSREREVRRLERLELQYIQRLQTTQAIQKESYGLLEKALAGADLPCSQ